MIKDLTKISQRLLPIRHEGYEDVFDITTHYEKEANWNEEGPKIIEDQELKKIRLQEIFILESQVLVFVLILITAIFIVRKRNIEQKIGIFQQLGPWLAHEPVFAAAGMANILRGFDFKDELFDGVISQKRELAFLLTPSAMSVWGVLGVGILAMGIVDGHQKKQSEFLTTNSFNN